MKLTKNLGGVLGVLLLVGLIFLLTRGKPKPPPNPKTEPRPVTDKASAGVKDAFAFAKDLEAKLRSDTRFARVYLVPSAATADQKHGKVVVAGEVATDEDSRALQIMIAKDGVPITLDWQVTVQQPDASVK